MTLNEISEILDNKIEINEEKVVLTFFEVRIKYNVSNEDLDIFLDLVKKRMNNLGYDVAFSGEIYNYRGNEYMVPPQEMVVAVKYKS